MLNTSPFHFLFVYFEQINAYLLRVIIILLQQLSICQMRILTGLMQI